MRLVLVLAVLVGCRTVVDVPAGGAGAGPSDQGGFAPSGGADAQSTTGAFMTGGAGVGPAGAGGQGGSCAPPAVGFEETDCCDSVPCWGDCIFVEGRATCDCYGTAGGCPSTMICCSMSASCVEPGHCDTLP